MVKNDVLRGSLMLLCAGSAILLLLFQWRMSVASTTTTPVEPLSPLLPLPEPSDNTLRLEVDLSDRRLYVYRGSHLQTTYPVAIGQEGWETPIGSFQVMEMQKNPTWRHPITDELVPPGPNNPLGNRWIGFWYDGRHLVGFHGTPKPKLVGQPVSHGCLRMRNSDILTLYQQVTFGTPVTVRE
jgi:L,D-transpeptidase ErfK/SrfK